MNFSSKGFTMYFTVLKMVTQIFRSFAEFRSSTEAILEVLLEKIPCHYHELQMNFKG